MKKTINSILMMLCLITSGFAVSSCDDSDQYLCDLLRNRDWQGYIGTYYQDRWHVTGNEYCTVWRFTSSDAWATSGRGEELDYDVHHRNSYAYCTFKWFIVDGELTLLYDDAVWSPYYIVDYSLTSSRFRGYIYEGSSRHIEFDLASQPYDDWYYYRNSNRGTGVYWSRGLRPELDDAESAGEPFIDRSEFCVTDDGFHGVSVLSGEFAKAFIAQHGQP